MKKNLLLFLLKLASLTLILGYVWFSGLQEQYPHLISPIAIPFFKFVGVTKWRLVLVLEHFTNLVPYIALVLSSPGIITHWKRMLTALLGGTAIIMLFHLLLSWAVFYFSVKYSLSKTFYKIIVPFYLVNDAMPLILWLVFYPHLPSSLFGLKGFGGEKR